ncbi:MAG TPA: hypothetical protein VG144_11395 [Gaiellaceae bacterium]|nr:hypothetical protein [Gaiellaceae bacterium]
MQGNSTLSRQIIVIAAVALGFVVGLMAASGAAGAGGRPTDTSSPRWLHETGALAGTSETFVDMRADGSYYDPSLGRRVYPGSSVRVAGTSFSPDDRPFPRSVGNLEPRTIPLAAIASRGFDWVDGAIGGAFGLALALLGTGAAIAYRRSTLSTA